jgi:hypothetical protein
MTDERAERLDLSALDAGDDAARRDALIAAVIARTRAVPQQPEPLLKLLRARRRVALVTAALAGLAATALILLPAPGTASAPAMTSDRLLGWVNANRAPTNAELLAAFLGYQP